MERDVFFFFLETVKSPLKDSGVLPSIRNDEVSSAPNESISLVKNVKNSCPSTTGLEKRKSRFTIAKCVCRGRNKRCKNCAPSDV